MSDLPNKARPSRRQFLVNTAAVGAAASMAGVLAACGGGSGGAPGGGGQGGSGGAKKPAGRAGQAGETLFVAGFQWGPPTNFNPFNSSPAWPCGQPGAQYVFESLVRFNLLDGKLSPGLAAEFDESQETVFVVKLQPDAHFSDGKPLTSADVVNTFDLAKRHPEVSYAACWDYFDKIEATDEKTVTFTLGTKPFNPKLARTYLTSVAILPKHVWDEKEKSGTPITQDENKDPVGSGPYKIEKYDQTQVGLVRDDNYWGKTFYGGLPGPKFINHPIFKGNQEGDLALQQGKIDVSQQFTPQIWQMWENRKLPVSTWFKKEPYHVPGSIPMLVLNTKKKPFSDVRVRRAIAFSINYADIADKAMSRYSTPANSSVILPTGSEEKYFNQENVDKNGWKYDPEQTAKILETELGAKKGNDGIYVLGDGTRMGPFTVQTPTGWTDWNTALQIVANNAKAAGIEIKTQFPQAPVVTQAVQNGNFELALWYIAGTGAAAPWQRFRDVLDLRGVPAPGKAAFWNYGRFTDPAVAALLDKAAGATEAELPDLYTQLDTIYMQNVPMIPLMYRPLEFFEFNESNWKGFPSEANPTGPPMFSGAGNEWLFKLERVSA